VFAVALCLDIGNHFIISNLSKLQLWHIIMFEIYDLLMQGMSYSIRVPFTFLYDHN